MSTDRRAAIVALALAACAPAPPSQPAPPRDVPNTDGPCGPGDATVILGGGTGPTATGFRALADGDGVYLTPGPQGGQHIWIGLRARGIDGTQPLVHLRAYRVGDDALIGQLRIRLRLIAAPEDASTLALSAQTLVIDDDRYCSVLDGAVRVTLDLDDAAGRCVHIERRLRVGGIDPAAVELDRNARLNCCTMFQRRCYPDGPPADAAVDAAADAR